MKAQIAKTLLSVGIGLSVGRGLAIAQTTYSSYVAGTQIHAAGNHWGNSDTTHHLLDTVTITVPTTVSRASWYAASAYTLDSSLINIYDAGLHCLAAPSGGCTPGSLYAHTGPLLSSQTNPTANTMISFPLVSDQNTVCSSYPCTLPVGTYSLTTGTSATAAKSMTLWSDGSTLTSGGAEFHIGNSFGDPANAFIAGYVTGVSSTPSGQNTQVTLDTTMLVSGQTISSFAAGMTILVAGLTPTQCNGLQNLTSVGVASNTLVYTISGSHTCALGADTCDGVTGGCVGAGLPPRLQRLIADQQNPVSGQFDGYYCYVGGASSECQRNNFVGPSGPQSGAHSVGITIY
jgi:hypothetical protein